MFPRLSDVSSLRGLSHAHLHEEAARLSLDDPRLPLEDVALRARHQGLADLADLLDRIVAHNHAPVPFGGGDLRRRRATPPPPAAARTASLPAGLGDCRGSGGSSSSSGGSGGSGGSGRLAATPARRPQQTSLLTRQLRGAAGAPHGPRAAAAAGAPREHRGAAARPARSESITVPVPVPALAASFAWGTCLTVGSFSGSSAAGSAADSDGLGATPP